MLINLLVAVISYFVIVFADNVLDIVKDFLALQVISQLENLFFMEYVMNREICKQILLDEKYHDLFKVQSTTSSDVKEHDKFIHDPATEWVNKMRQKSVGNKKDRPTPRTVKIEFATREWFFEMPLYLFYKLIRILFVAFWFYFSPFFAMTLQFLIPYFQLSIQDY